MSRQVAVRHDTTRIDRPAPADAGLCRTRGAAALRHGALFPLALTLCLLAGSTLAAERGLVLGRNGMAASIHPLASKVGIDVLEAGGNAADAAVAMAAVLNVVDAPMTGIGGDAFALVYSAADGEVHALNASGRSPYAAARQYFVEQGHAAVPPLSIHAVNVPGALDGWVKLLERFGTMPLGELLAPAIRYAEEGIPVNEGLLRWYRIPLSDPSAVETYYIDGRPPRLGELLVQPDLARTLRTIAEQGPDAFYRGEIGRKIVDFARSRGGFLAMRDLAEHRSEWVAPIRTTYRGLEVVGFPPNTQGLALLQQLNLLEGHGLAAMGHNSADAIHLMIEAKKLAFADRDAYIADPDFFSAPLERLLSKAYARERRGLIDMQRAAEAVVPGDPDPHNTTYLAVVDREGNAVSFINSLRNPWGVRLVAGNTGVLLHNRGRDFTLEPGHPNVYEPHKRSFNTNQPALVLKDGRPHLVLGCAGAYQQTLALVQLLTNMVDFGMQPQDAIEARRWTHLQGRSMSLEYGIPGEVRAELSRRGHEIVSEHARGVIWGLCQIIRIDPQTGTYQGASESRAAGAALGY